MLQIEQIRRDTLSISNALLSEGSVGAILNNPESYIGYHASCEGESLGVIVVRKEEQANTYTLKTLLVHPDYRRMGIATRLWKQFEKGQDLSVIYRLHSLSKEDLTELQLFLKAQNYTESAPYEIEFIGRFFVNPQELFPWISKLLPPKDVYCNFWEDLPLEAQKKLRTSATAPIYKLNSLAAIHQDNIIGWVLAYERSPEHIHYGNTYVHPKYRGSILPPYLMSRSLMRHYEHRHKIPYVSTSVRYPFPKGSAHLVRTCGRLAERIEEVRRITRKRVLP